MKFLIVAWIAINVTWDGAFADMFSKLVTMAILANLAVRLPGLAGRTFSRRHRV